ncbi:hypothetical protein E1A91_D02G147700v1 [Gossypium mustelinum]|uniref:Uncharacterized protein n=1 Tax=Gossypium mustelinum TaxID=34275 RepID=A0A5D2VWI2_GOSMU|nr:hypothetical protein E1A91_D02G147700v1 [Gossypium mustelinum]TYI93619.1 hypothetical protein E1A91_D02G147700v1 [Gossypium mustelinum]
MVKSKKEIRLFRSNEENRNPKKERKAAPFSPFAPHIRILPSFFQLRFKPSSTRASTTCCHRVSRSWKRRATCAKADERGGNCCGTEERKKKTAAMVSVTFGQLGLVIGLELTQVYWVWLYIIWVRATIGYYRRV